MSTWHNPIGTVRRESHDDGGHSVWVMVDSPLAGHNWLCIQSTAPGNVMEMLPSDQNVDDWPVIGWVDLRLDFVVTGFTQPAKIPRTN
jgi:hypothetical protein